MWTRRDEAEKALQFLETAEFIYQRYMKEVFLFFRRSQLRFVQVLHYEFRKKVPVLRTFWVFVPFQIRFCQMC